ncbi:MAG TPA: hypothetical protein VLI94_07590 [Solirubrobacterales bacterium]|nr:hypothetical protein [Solirubrobacterales bacterium]
MPENPQRIEEVESLSSKDQDVIDQVRRVLEENGALDRFGLTLLHSHFDLGPDEVLVETVDADSRTLTIRPLDRSELMRKSDPIQTSWRLDGPDNTPIGVLYCHRPKEGQFHAKSVDSH